jgi:hypothetical protein
MKIRQGLMIATILVLISMASCGTSNPPDDWILHSNDKFSFRGPRDLRAVPVQSIDSFVGRLESQRFHISFDYGWYSDNSFEGHIHLPNFNVEEVSINGKRARLGFYDDNKHPKTHPFLYAAYFPDILGIGERELGETKLYFKVCFDDLQFRGMAKHILMSIRMND